MRFDGVEDKRAAASEQSAHAIGVERVAGRGIRLVAVPVFADVGFSPRQNTVFVEANRLSIEIRTEEDAFQFGQAEIVAVIAGAITSDVKRRAFEIALRE